MAQLLVVEDNPDILHLIWTQLRARGHQVLGASSGPEALAAVELWGPPQVAVLDVAMPSMDGLELLQRLRAATGMPELPAIFLSARVDRQTVEAAHRLGAAYLAKPFMEEILPPSRQHSPTAPADSERPSKELSSGCRALDRCGRWRISARGFQPVAHAVRSE
jgi:CheY-like chemotaxis protein